MNIKQPTTLELDDTEKVMAYNEYLDLPPPQDISNVFAAADLTSRSSSDSNKYKRAWIKVKVIRSSILYAGKRPEIFSRALSIAPNHKEIASIIAATGAISPQKKPMQLPDMNKIKLLSHATSVGNKQKTNGRQKYNFHI